MTQSLTAKTVGELVAERPARARVFESYGIDYCCGGKRLLLEACATQGVDAAVVLAALAVADQEPRVERRDWTQAPLSELATHIVETHHAYLRTELPRLSGLFERVVRAHAARHPEVSAAAGVFEALREELEQHMNKEEQILFPIIDRLEAGLATAADHCGSVDNPIRQMEHEHDEAGVALSKLRALTGDYVPPADACNTYRALLDSLERFERDMHTHIHKENNILFPRAAAVERQLVSAA